MSMQVVQPGLLSHFQDLGRRGWRRLGIAPCGAADRASFELGARLVGAAAPFPAALELSVQGPRLRFSRAVCIALTGAPIEAQCGDFELPAGRPLWLPAGSELRLGRVLQGVRSYLHLASGWVIAPLLDSQSTDLRAGFGGWQGRALRPGDRIDMLAPGNRRIDRPHWPQWSILPAWTPRRDDTSLLRFVASSTAPDAAVSALATHTWRVASSGNRQGLPLHGPAIVIDGAGAQVSAPVLPGTIQLPPSGLPIVLGCDAQTVGGYPVLGQIIDADLDRLAQLPANAMLKLQEVEPADAEHLARRRAAELARAALAIEHHLRALLSKSAD